MQVDASSESGIPQGEQPQRTEISPSQVPKSLQDHVALAITQHAESGGSDSALRMIRDSADKILENGEAALPDIKESTKANIDHGKRDLFLQDPDRAKEALGDLPVIDSVSLGTALDGGRSTPVFRFVDTNKIVGMSFNARGEGWAGENTARAGRIEQVAQNILKGSEDSLEEIFHPGKSSERVKLTAIQGPSGPMYYVDDGTHRVSGSKLAGIEEVPANVSERTYPSTHYSYDSLETQHWEQLIKIGLIEGKISRYTSQGGREGVVLHLQSEVLPWIRNPQSKLIKTSELYESMYPGSLDNLPIPKEALLDPIANNFFMAGRWGEWVELHKSEPTEATISTPAQESTTTEVASSNETKGTLTPEAQSGYISGMAKIADEALAANDPGRLQKAIDELPKDNALRERISEVLRAKGIPVKSPEPEEKASGESTSRIDYHSISEGLP